ncbi:MAG: hypothetical protein DLM57_03150 [Pseudonocardiales bacterium]|nr:MAG: hypothetical protein DLM57_03150 [Pseudonocardiales bacterium]
MWPRRSDSRAGPPASGPSVAARRFRRVDSTGKAGDDALLIGTWNVQGRWSPAHRTTLQRHECDVWLLTEVSDDLELPGYHAYRSAALMASRRRWSAVLTRDPVQQLADPHPASAAIAMDDATYCASILPWRSCGSRAPWVGQRHADKTAAAVSTLDAALPPGPLVWGGDWNHALIGKEYSGSLGGRSAITQLLARRRLRVPTSDLPHQIDGLLSIDHIAVDHDVRVARAERFTAAGLSDHDGYLVETDPTLR